MLEKLKARLSEKTEQIVNFIKLSEEERNIRLDICKSCENFTNYEFCKICHCYMPAKTYIPTASCPIKKWDIKT